MRDGLAPGPVVDRRCARPDCSQRSAVSLTCDYAARTVFIGPVGPVDDPARYDLCARHAARFRPPHGWELVEEREPALAAGNPATA